MRRYFSESPLALGAVTLDGSEAHHLLHVARAKVGDEVVLFDGRGAEFPAQVTALGRRDLTLQITASQEISRELPLELTLAVALPKGDRQRWLVEKLVEVGVTRLVPLISAYSNEQTTEGSLAKLRRAVIEASKQSGRNRLMEVLPAHEWSSYCSVVPGPKWIAHPGGSSPLDAAGILKSCEPLTIAVGPEGGFRDDELAAASATGWREIGLGPRILRVETAAVTLAALAAMKSESPLPSD